MPKRILDWFISRGISEETIANAGIFHDGSRIVIPVFDQDGKLIFNKYRRDPYSLVGPKYTYDNGGKVSLYGIANLPQSNRIFICEGEFDCLLLMSKGFCAVTSTGGANSFQEEWIPLFAGKEVFVCLDNDKAGRDGTLRICNMMPNVKTIPLPPDVGEHGDITDFFIKLGHTKQDFEFLASVSSAPPRQVEKPIKKKRVSKKIREFEEGMLAQAKKIPLSAFVKFTYSGFAKCPIHSDKTASFKKYPDEKFYCFGCGARGDVIDLVMKIHNISMKEAIELLLNY
jgi:DNA primase